MVHVPRTGLQYKEKSMTLFKFIYLKYVKKDNFGND